MFFVRYNFYYVKLWAVFPLNIMLNTPYPPPTTQQLPTINPNPIKSPLQPLSAFPPIMSNDKQYPALNPFKTGKEQPTNSYQGKPSPGNPQPLNNNLNGKTKKTGPPGLANNKAQFQTQPKSYGGILQECVCGVLLGCFLGIGFRD